MGNSHLEANEIFCPRDAIIVPWADFKQWCLDQPEDRPLDMCCMSTDLTNTLHKHHSPQIIYGIEVLRLPQPFHGFSKSLYYIPSSPTGWKLLAQFEKVRSLELFQCNPFKRVYKSFGEIRGALQLDGKTNLFM